MAAIAAAAESKDFASSHNTHSSNPGHWQFGSGLRNQDDGMDQYANGYDSNPDNRMRAEETERSASLENSKSQRVGKKMDASYLMPYKQSSRQDLAGSRSNSEPDSLIDLYGHPRSMTERSPEGNRNKSESHDPDSIDQHDPDNNVEESNWIHRDKLAIIESREMQAAGISPSAIIRSSSKSRHRREKSDTIGVEQDEVPQVRENKKRRVKHITKDEEPEEEIPLNKFDVRTPQEIAAESYQERSTSPIYRQQTPRSSSSKIPLPRSSPMPLPQEYLERTTPLPRKRNASGTWSGGDEDGIAYNRLRSRGDSVGSQTLLDDGVGGQIPSSPTGGFQPLSGNSPTKAKNGGAQKQLHGRKSSISNSTSGQKPRSASSGASPSTPLQRPKSRSGLEPRPPTAVNRPEGEPPWLKDMYKPDPRLPPDQQLLPTHAKRLQEQSRRQDGWEQPQRSNEEHELGTTEEVSGRGGSTGKDTSMSPFSPLAIHTRKGLQPTQTSSRDPNDLHHDQTGPEWPLGRSNRETGGAASDPNSPTSTTQEKAGNAGYSPIPRIRSGQTDSGEPKSPITGLRQPGNQQHRAAAVDPFDKERMERITGNNDADADTKKKDKGCGCCVVM